MKNMLIIIGFIILAIALYVIWGSLNSKIVAIESDTGSYIYTQEDDSGVDIDIEALREQLALLEAAQSANAEAIASLLRRMEKIEAQGCAGASCANKIVRRETIFFEHDDSKLSPAEKDKIDSLLTSLSGKSLVSLRGHADTSGNNQYNHLLSLQRAAAVKRYIDKMLSTDEKLNKLLVTVDGSGEESVVNATEDGVEEPSNRVVEILIFE